LITHRCQPTGCVDAVVLWCVIDYIALTGSGENKTTGHKVLPPVLMGRNEERDGPPSISHLNRFPRRNSGEVAAGVLTKLPDPNPFHVLHGSM